MEPPEPVFRFLLIDEVNARMVPVDRADPVGELVRDGREPRSLGRSGELRGERAGDLRGAGPPGPPIRQHPLKGIVAVSHEPRIEGGAFFVRVADTRGGGGRDVWFLEWVPRLAMSRTGQARQRTVPLDDGPANGPRRVVGGEKPLTGWDIGVRFNRDGFEQWSQPEPCFETGEAGPEVSERGRWESPHERWRTRGQIVGGTNPSPDVD